MNAVSSTPGRWASPQTEVDRVAILLINAWETAEGTQVNPSRVATFVDMARAVIADRATAPDTAQGPREHGEPAEQCPWCGGKDRSVRPERTDMGVPCNNLAWHTTAPTPDNLNPVSPTT